MKRNDITLIAVCVIVGGVLSLLVVNLFISPSKQKEQVEVVEAISSEFKQPDNAYFNNDAYNPTQEIEIGNGSSQPQFGQD